MNIFKLSWKNLINKKLNSFLCVLLLALGVSIISFLMLMNQQLQEKFTKNIEGIDMVIGAKGSPLQLILSAVYQIDAPTGNIPMEEFQKIAQNPMVKKAIPLSMGDNFKGFRIIGTNKLYPEHFKGILANGQLFSNPLEVTIGSQVAINTGLKTGDAFSSSHGLNEKGEAHDDQKYKVVGIFKSNQSVLDNVILTPLASIWQVHEHEENQQNKQQDITAGLLVFRNKMGIVMLPRIVNESSRLQSAVPAPEINRLFSMLGVGINTLQALALAIMIVAAISVFISLYNTLKERKFEMALMLSMGSNRYLLFCLLLIEGLILALLGYMAGIMLSRIGIWLTSSKIGDKYHYNFEQQGLLNEEIWLFAATILLVLIAAAIPSLGIYKINISKTLAED